ncbi:MAG: pyridoxal-dependent decarboxylase [Chloroflexota bacterium]|nr:pyridoxal-dependent decarboxylase [Chloroflexota bacterium]
MEHIEYGDIPLDTFREYGHELIEWVARYLEHPEQYPVLAQVKPGEIHAALPESPPAERESLDEILADFHETILPGVTHWNHPGFFAYFAITSSAPGILAELLSAALNVNGMLWKTSPSATELEEVALDWLRQMLGLGDGWFGIINDTASISSLLALAAAREWKPELQIRQKGMAGRDDLPVLRVYTSEQSHSSIDKAAIMLGMGHENVVHIEVDEQFRMRPESLHKAIRADKAAGHLPIATVATVGTTSTTSIDPVRAIADICKDEGLWLHVDGAYGGVAAVVPEMQWILDGIELAHSLVVNPHKWLFTPIDLSAFFTRHPDVLKRAFSLVPEYLVTAEQDEVTNFMDYGVQLGRCFRALKLWMVIRAFGVEGIAARLRGHIAMAQQFARWVDAAKEWERVAPTPFSTVCFRYAPDGVEDVTINEWNEQILNDVNASGEVYLSHTKLHDKFTLRLAIGNIRTEPHHVERAWHLLQKATEEVKQRALHEL